MLRVCLPLKGAVTACCPVCGFLAGALVPLGGRVLGHFGYSVETLPLGTGLSLVGGYTWTVSQAQTLLKTPRPLPGGPPGLRTTHPGFILTARADPPRCPLGPPCSDGLSRALCQRLLPPNLPITVSRSCLIYG